MNSLQIKVYGKVQGVFFRASTKEVAENLFIRGVVKNERDGSVYIEAEGETENLEKFIEWLKHGPTNAVVKDVKIKANPEPKKNDGFKVLA